MMRLGSGSLGRAAPLKGHGSGTQGRGTSDEPDDREIRLSGHAAARVRSLARAASAGAGDARIARPGGEKRRDRLSPTCPPRLSPNRRTSLQRSSERCCDFMRLRAHQLSDADDGRPATSISMSSRAMRDAAQWGGVDFRTRDGLVRRTWTLQSQLEPDQMHRVGGELALKFN